MAWVSNMQSHTSMTSHPISNSSGHAWRPWHHFCRISWGSCSRSDPRSKKMSDCPMYLQLDPTATEDWPCSNNQWTILNMSSMNRFPLTLWCSRWTKYWQNIQTLQSTSWWPPKSQCFTVRATKCGAIGVWFLSSIGANAPQLTLTLNFGGRGFVYLCLSKFLMQKHVHHISWNLSSNGCHTLE